MNEKRPSRVLKATKADEQGKILAGRVLIDGSTLLRFTTVSTNLMRLRRQPCKRHKSVGYHANAQNYKER